MISSFNLQRLFCETSQQTLCGTPTTDASATRKQRFDPKANDRTHQSCASPRGVQLRTRCSSHAPTLEAHAARRLVSCCAGMCTLTNLRLLVCRSASSCMRSSRSAPILTTGPDHCKAWKHARHRRRCNINPGCIFEGQLGFDKSHDQMGIVPYLLLPGGTVCLLCGLGSPLCVWQVTERRTEFNCTPSECREKKKRSMATKIMHIDL